MERTTHRYDGELVVFLIGMTITKWWRVDHWLPVLRAMPGMLKELMSDPDSGLMGYKLAFGPDGPLLVQYWSSVDKLYAYASDREARHRPAWAEFNRRARSTAGAVGVWHETYRVDKAESVYVGTPPMGLAKATERVPVTEGRNSARQRLEAA
jgi:hypothetical protein